MKLLKFCKEGKYWYIDFLEWKGRKSALMMVGGAHTLLDLMAQGKQDVLIYVDEEDFEGAEHLKLIDLCWFNGANYRLETYKSYYLHLKVWLCDVTLKVLGEFPDDIYFAKIN